MKLRNTTLWTSTLMLFCLWAVMPLRAFADAPDLGDVVPGDVLVGVRQDQDDAVEAARLSATVGQK